MILLLSAALAAPAQGDLANDYRGYMDQARFFLRKGWLADAREQVELAALHPDGALDGEVWLMLASLRAQTGALASAKLAASTAHSHARTPLQLEQAVALEQWLDESFGRLTVEGQQHGLRTALRLDAITMPVDAEASAALAAVRAAHPRVSLPIALTVPVGAYEVNGVPTIVSASEAVSVRVNVEHAAPTWLQTSTLRLRPQIADAISWGPAAPPLGFGALLGWLVPLGPLHIEPRAQLNVRPDGGPTLASGGLDGAGGLLLGAGLPLADALMLDASAGLMLGSALAPPCPAPACPAQGTQLALAPLVELSLSYLERYRPHPVGLGLSAALTRRVTKAPSSYQDPEVTTGTNTSVTVGVDLLFGL